MLYSLEDFNLNIKPRLVRLSGCTIYVPDPGAPRSGYRKIDGGRAVFIEKSGDTTGLAVVSRQVVRVKKVDCNRWNVDPEAQAVA